MIDNYLPEANPESSQNYRKRSLTHYDVISIECFVNHSPPILLPSGFASDLPSHFVQNKFALKKTIR